MLTNLWVQLGGIGVIGFLFWQFQVQLSRAMQDNVTATRENTAAVARLVGMLEGALPGLTAQGSSAAKRSDVA